MGRSRVLMEARFGRPGSGARRLTIAGEDCTLAEAMARLGIGFDGCRTIDGFALGPAHFALRYYDPEEQRLVAYEFDAEFRYLGELRVHVAEWLGEDADLPPWEAAAGWNWTST
jgi:hypothetical protein